jgi:hypothetical protein
MRASGEGEFFNPPDKPSICKALPMKSFFTIMTKKEGGVK